MRFTRTNEQYLRRQMCEIGRRIWLRGLCAGCDGNHSVRMGANRVLCTPTGMSKGFLKPHNLCVVDMEGRQLAGHRKPTTEILMHLAIFKARPDVRAVVHSHPPPATAIAISGASLPTGIYPEVETFLGAVPTVRYVLPGDHRLARAILPCLRDTNTLILQNHGTVTFDVDLEQAYLKLEVVDAYARMVLMLQQLGSVRRLTQREMAEILQFKVRAGLPDTRLRERKDHRPGPKPQLRPGKSPLGTPP